MAAIASAQSGAWNSAATWVGGIIPVAGDAVSTSGTHAIYVPDGYNAECATLAQSFTAGTLAMDVQPGASLRIGADTDATYSATGWSITPSASTATVAVTIRGQLYLHQGVTQGLCTVQFHGGCTIEGSRAVAHATMIGWKVATTQTANANGRIEHVNNSTALPVRVQGSVGTGSNPSTQGGPYFYGGTSSGGGLVWVDGTGVASTIYTRCAGGATPLFNDGPFSVAAQKIIKRNAIFDGCGKLFSNGLAIPAACDMLFENCTAKNSSTVVTDYNITILATAALTSPGRRLLRRLRLDRKLSNSCKNISLTDIGWDIPHGGSTQTQYIVTASTSGPPDLAEKIFCHSGDSVDGGQTTTWPYGTVIDRLYYLGDTCNNPHPNIFGLNYASAATTQTTVTRALTQVYGNTNDLGDTWLVFNNPANVQNVALRNCIQLPNGTTKTRHSMKFSGISGNIANIRMTYEHNTIFTGGGGTETGINIGESQTAATTGIIASLKSNLSYGLGAAGTYRYLLLRIQGTFQDHVDPANVDYNCMFQNDNDGVNPLGIGTGPGNTGSIWSTGNTNYGPHNISADPQILDTRFRDVGVLYNDTFGTSLAAIDALRAGVAEMMKANDGSGFNPAFNIDSIIDWVMAGYAPQNVALQAAHDAGAPLTAAGAWIGAVAGSAPAGGGGAAYYTRQKRAA